jgi:hypothetical protein
MIAKFDPVKECAYPSPELVSISRISLTICIYLVFIFFTNAVYPPHLLDAYCFLSVCMYLAHIDV